MSLSSQQESQEPQAAESPSSSHLFQQPIASLRLLSSSISSAPAHREPIRSFIHSHGSARDRPRMFLFLLLLLDYHVSCPNIDYSFYR